MVMDLNERVLTTPGSMAILDPGNARGPTVMKRPRSVVEKMMRSWEKKEEQEKKGELSREDIEEAIEEIQGRFEAMGSSFKFGLHEDREAEIIVGQLRDKSTGEVVRQFPSEEVLQLREKFQDLVGLIFDEKV